MPNNVEASLDTPLLWGLREIGNAIYKLTAKRIRALPLEDGGITFV